MPAVADIVRRSAASYLQRFGTAVPRAHRHVLDTIAACRTGQLGTVVFACSDCGHRHHIGRSCGNRHCPTCQHDKGRAWLERHLATLLCCPYFFVTFTVPAELRRFMRSHPRITYDALFRASSQALRLLLADPRYVGTPTPGFFGVLHTWGRTLEYHPHIHYVVAAGGPSADGTRWLSARADFLVPVRALSPITRARFRDAMQRAGLLGDIDPEVWRKDWVVHAKPVGDGRAALKYLAPYVFRVAITDRRIRSSDEHQVTFTWRQSGSRRPRAMTLAPHEFLRRLLQHVLPRGFQKVRRYGFLCANTSVSLEHVQWLTALHADERFVLACTSDSPSPPRPLARCGECGGTIRPVAFIRFNGRALYDTS
jgi:hypothetical protein